MIIPKCRHVTVLLTAKTKDHKARHLHTLQLETVSREFCNVEKVILLPGNSIANF